MDDCLLSMITPLRKAVHTNTLPENRYTNSGYGLSYTKFNYRKLNIASKQDTINIQFSISNTGKYDGDEVAKYMCNILRPEHTCRSSN